MHSGEKSSKCNQCDFASSQASDLRRHVKTHSGTYNWPNLEPMQVVFFLAGEITQVKESIPWVRCASGNVFWNPSLNSIKNMSAPNISQSHIHLISQSTMTNKITHREKLKIKQYIAIQNYT